MGQAASHSVQVHNISAAPCVSSRSLVPGLLTFTVCQPVDVLPPGDGGLLWILADLHLRPLVHLHQLTEAEVNVKHMEALEGSSEADLVSV